MPRGVARCAAEQELHVRALRPGGGAARREPEEEGRVMASREALTKFIQFGNAEQFATHAEDWSACSSAAILNAAVEQLGKLTQQRAYKDNACLGGLPHCQQRCLPLLFLRRSVTKELAPEWSGVVETCCGRLSCWQWGRPPLVHSWGWGAAQARRCKGSVFF